jgi:hypothetical protein
MAPIRRSVQLRPLSSVHHDVLLLAFQLKLGAEGRAGAGSDGRPETLQRLVREQAAQLREHFDVEERALEGLEPSERARLVGDHQRLRSLLSELEAESIAAPARLGAFAAQLEAHVRWEERELFGALEARLSADVLERIAGALATHGSQASCAIRR